MSNPLPSGITWCDFKTLKCAFCKAEKQLFETAVPFGHFPRPKDSYQKDYQEFLSAHADCKSDLGKKSSATMTVREQFAMSAMAALIAGFIPDEMLAPDATADRATAYADALVRRLAESSHESAARQMELLKAAPVGTYSGEFGEVYADDGSMERSRVMTPNQEDSVLLAALMRPCPTEAIRGD